MKIFFKNNAYKKPNILKVFLVFIFFTLLLSNSGFKTCFAESDEQYTTKIYTVYDDDGNLIFESSQLSVGDKIIDKDFKEYEIYSIDEGSCTAVAEYNGRYKKPNVKKHSKGLNFSNNNIEKSVGIYMTHNDESYLPSDGYSSIYGKGGVHDVAKEIKKHFENLNYEVFFDESLHLPHDSGAYSRSSSTAKSLLKYSPDAIFDIHRDGVSRSVYVKNINGTERCKVRIVVGQANPNKDANMQFALYLMSVAEQYCPWLFLDIYQAKGHYNQALSSKGLLFEMGTYLAEKDLVLDTTKYLVDIIDKTLFSTIVEDDQSLTITDEITPDVEDKIVNNVLQEAQYKTDFFSKYSGNIVAFSIAFVVICSVIAISTIYLRKRKKVTKK